MEENVGIIGVGLLGTALLHRMRMSGFAVVGYDPDPDAVVRLKSAGAAAAESPEHVARQCRRMLLSLPGPREVEDSLRRIDSQLMPGMIVLDTTTGDPEAVEFAAAQLGKRRVAYLDCEVGGSSKQTVAGEAILICGGNHDAYVACLDILSSISDRAFYTGAAGSGTRMKLALNIAIGLHRAVLAEALEFARANGIEGERALEILKAGPGYSKAMDVKGSKMLAGDFAPEARLAQHLKDVRVILKTGRMLGAHLPFSHLHEQLLSEGVDLGYGSEDNSAIIKLFRRTYE